MSAPAPIPFRPRVAGRSEPPEALLVNGALALQPALPYLDAPEPAGPPVARTAVIVVRALLEVLQGWRPVSQLARWTSHPLQIDLEDRVPRRPTGTRLQLRRLRISEPAAGVAEVCALADDPIRQRIPRHGAADGAARRRVDRDPAEAA